MGERGPEDGGGGCVGTLGNHCMFFAARLSPWIALQADISGHGLSDT